MEQMKALEVRKDGLERTLADKIDLVGDLAGTRKFGNAIAPIGLSSRIYPMRFAALRNRAAPSDSNCIAVRKSSTR